MKSALAVVGVATLILTAAPARRAVAHDETADTEIKIAAPLDAVDCTAQTITLLGLVIDISTAAIEAQGNAAPTPSASPSPTTTADDSTHAGGTDANGSHGSRPVGSTSPGGCYYFCPPTPLPTQSTQAVQNPQGTSGCAALAPGQSVEVRLAGDQPPLAANEIKQQGESEDLKIQAPLQGVDSIGLTVTLLGLTVDVSGAGLDGSDDGGEHSQPIDVSQFSLGQFVEVQLAANTPPFAATELEVKNFTNQAEIEVDGADHSAVDDIDENGDPVDDVEIDITETVAVHDPAGAGVLRKQLHFHTRSNGSANVSGLPTGVARIQVTRTHSGSTQVGRSILRVRSNTTRRVRIRVRNGR